MMRRPAWRAWTCGTRGLGAACTESLRLRSARGDGPAPGSTVWLNLRAISAWRWHPFTVSETGEGVALVPELWEVLERALARHPEHPGLCHLWIHMLEMAPQPGACVRIG